MSIFNILKDLAEEKIKQELNEKMKKEAPLVSELSDLVNETNNKIKEIKKLINPETRTSAILEQAFNAAKLFIERTLGIGLKSQPYWQAYEAYFKAYIS